MLQRGVVLLEVRLDVGKIAQRNGIFGIQLDGLLEVCDRKVDLLLPLADDGALVVACAVCRIELIDLVQSSSACSYCPKCISHCDRRYQASELWLSSFTTWEKM